MSGAAQVLGPRLRAAGLDHDAINVIVRVTKRADVPPALADQWALGWDDQALRGLFSLAQADRQHLLAASVDAFLQHPSHVEQRVTRATQGGDTDLRTAGELATRLRDVLTAFGRDILVSATSPFTGKVRYSTLTDLDVVTTKAIIEVSTQPDAAGKVAQLAVLLGPHANPSGLPIFHFLPNVSPASPSANSLRAAGSAGVYNDAVLLEAAVRALS